MSGAAKTPDVSYLISSSAHRALEFRRYLGRLAQREHPSESPKLLIEAIEIVVDQVILNLIDLARVELCEPGRRSIEGQVRALSQALDQLAVYVEPAAISVEGDLPWGLVYPFEVFCRRMTPESRVVIYPHWQQGYAYREMLGPLRKILAGVPMGHDSGLLKGFPRHLAAVSYPAAHGVDILENAAWGHEIGHHLDTVFGVSDKILQTPISEPLEQSAVTLGMAVDSDGQRGDSAADDSMYLRLLELKFKCMQSWVGELVADVFSINAFGPASLFAFADIVPALCPLDKPSLSHPPPGLRMSAMLSELQHLGYDQLFNGQTDGAAGRVRAAVKGKLGVLGQHINRAPESFVDSDFYAPILGAVVSAIPLIAQGVREVTRLSWVCSADKIADDVFQLVDRLESHIPPCEVDVPDQLQARDTSLAAIVNAGWFCLIDQGLDRLPRSEKDASDLQVERDKLNRLVLKAIELSAARRYLLATSTER